jgi:hypothetical protein
MKLALRLITETPEATLSILTVDGTDFCFILEDGHKDVKVPGKTRIPAGLYPMGLRTKSPMAMKYDSKFAAIRHSGMLHILNIPKFENVYFHIGNTVLDTAGCPLVGTGAVMSSGALTVTGSTVAYQELYPAVWAAILSGTPVTLAVVRR